MNISTLIDILNDIKEEHGDLDVNVVDKKKGMIEIKSVSVADIIDFVNIDYSEYKKVFIHI